MNVVIIGGVAGGAAAAARLRRLDESASIIVVERGEHISFANCGLPYYIGGEITDREKLTLQTPESFRRRFGVEVRNFTEATAIDRKNHRLEVKDLTTGQTYFLPYDKLILSPGAAPAVPPIAGADGEGVFTLRNIPDADAIKKYIESTDAKTALVVGAGFIGVEMAENLTHAGLKVTVAEFADHVIPPLDYDMAAQVENGLRAHGVDVFVGSAVTEIKTENNRRIAVVGGREVEADLVILSAGVRPDTRLAVEAGLKTDGRGCILTDSYMRTSDEEIYAAGDAVSPLHAVTGQRTFIPLAGPAAKMGRTAADHICGLCHPYTGSRGTSVLKVFDMTVASTGLSEAQAVREGLDVDRIYATGPNHAGYYPGAGQLCIKVVYRKEDGVMVGAQAVGYEGVDKRMDVLATAMAMGGKVTDLVQLQLCYAPPFGSAKDPINMLGFQAENINEGLMTQFYWQEVDSLPRDGSVLLLDVRKPEEIEATGFIDGFTRIPVDDLREKLDELPKVKDAYICCHSGVRSYVACRMLAGHGYTCHNLAGGYHLYYEIKKAEAERK